MSKSTVESTSSIVPFSFESKEVRTIQDEHGDPWFVAKDVCNILGYVNSRKAINDHLDDDEKGVTTGDTLGGSQEMTIINESGLYTLIIRSNKPEAKKFRKWVTSEVLPAIRKTGTYSIPDVSLKRCSRCGQVKPLSDFDKNIAKRDGHCYTCKACHSEMAKKRYLNRKLGITDAKQPPAELDISPCQDILQSVPDEATAMIIWRVFHQLSVASMQRANEINEGTIDSLRERITRLEILKLGASETA